mgnify:CR=1 FL=1
MTAHACSPVLLPSGERGSVGRLCGCLTDGGRHGRHGRRAGFRLESGDFADRMYARIVPSAQNAERVIQTFVSLLLTGAVHRQFHCVGREAVRQCKAADALLLGGRLRRVRAAAGAGGRLSHRRPHGGGAVRLRGPDPAGVLDLAMERKNIIALKGNHEDAFVDWYDTVPDKIHNRYYYNTYDFLMDSRRTRERLPEYVEFMRKMPLYKKLRIDGECWLLAHACTEEVLSFWKRKERMLWSTEMIDRGKGIPGYHSVVGHVPAFTIRGNTNRPAKIWHSEDGWLTDIDCGAAFPAFGGRLGCLCLETGEEYYVADAEILTT